ncbi:MAG: methyltransferase domain-containing protein [Rhodospirillaceae bacterium]|nr:methyltransferase domain-containing protein [Rhodospirillaceae bacterium]MDD9996833.1 methyltransferase domain-containing protein [Rhodospirillaceae bacterium]MDE0361729.1 methyltransferase domain-containing protein [Rhodospirillaceae bacterium]
MTSYRNRMLSGVTTSLHRQRRFLGTLVREPLSVGAVAPSSRRLAGHMVADIVPGSRVIELGAGTGAVTRAILDSGVTPNDLLVIEQNEAFSEMLRKRFPGIEVITGNAVGLNRYVRALPGPADFVVSGLPLLLFSPGRKLRLLHQVFSVLTADGAFHQFTYGGRCPVERAVLRRLGLEATLLRFTPINMPPAFVYRLQRRR